MQRNDHAAMLLATFFYNQSEAQEPRTTKQCNNFSAKRSVSFPISKMIRRVKHILERTLLSVLMQCKFSTISHCHCLPFPSSPANGASIIVLGNFSAKDANKDSFNLSTSRIRKVGKSSPRFFQELQQLLLQKMHIFIRYALGKDYIWNISSLKRYCSTTTLSRKAAESKARVLRGERHGQLIC